MKYNPAIHKRKSIRLKGYDYSKPGLYYVTICVQNRECLFGKIENKKMHLNDAGIMIQNEWLAIPERFPQTQLHEFIVMPNHFHAILEITPSSATPPVAATLVVVPNNEVVDNPGPATTVTPVEPIQPPLTEEEDINNSEAELFLSGQPQGFAPTEKKSKTLGDILGAFQSITTVKYIRGVNDFGWKRFKGKLWQRNYFERIIRNQRQYDNIKNYTRNNPAKWEEDKLKKKG